MELWGQSVAVDRKTINDLFTINFFKKLFIYFLFSTGVPQVVLVVKNLSANAGDIRHAGLIPGSGRSPGEGQGNPLEYFCLENPMDRGAWLSPWSHKDSDMTKVTQCAHSWFTYQFQVYSKVIQLYICPFFFRSFCHIGYYKRVYRILSRVSCAITIDSQSYTKIRQVLLIHNQK